MHPISILPASPKNHIPIFACLTEAQVMTNTKSFILFQPAHLFSNKPIISLKQLIKIPTGIETVEQPLTYPQLNKWFKIISKETINALMACSPYELKRKSSEINRQVSYILNKEEKEAMVQKAYKQHLFSLVGAFRRLNFKEWYHTVQTTSKRIQNIKCSFHPYPVELIFFAQQQSKQYEIEIFVEMGKERFSISSFNRIYFLLEKENVYYQLSQRSYEALSWLETEQATTGIIDHIDNLEIILNKLKGWQVTVEESNIKKAKTIEVVPQAQVLLSELSNTFLKLEPQFIYDGIIVDGPFEDISFMQIEDKTVSIKRNKEKETELVDFLRSLHEKFNNQNNGFFYLSFADAQKKGWFLKNYYLLLDKNVALRGIDMLKHFRYSPYKAVTTITQNASEGDIECINISVQFGKETVPLNILQKALYNNQKAVMLTDGSLGVFGEEWHQQYGLIVKHGKIRGNELLVAKWLMLGDVTDAPGTTTALTASFAKTWLAKWKQWEKQEAGLYSLPAHLKVKNLRPYQRTGFEWLRLLEEIGAGACLADDMGLGKTLQTIGFLLYKIESKPLSKQLVVAPASLLYNWQKELEKFAPKVKATVLHGTKRDIASLSENETEQIFITSYGTMRQDVHLLETIAWETIVLDESHHIKNQTAQTTKAAWRLNAKTKIALSGTPIMNSTADLHSQMHFLMPGLLGTPDFFEKEYIIPIEQQANEEKAAVLQKLIRPFLLRRTKEQVAKELPDKTESVLWCEMGHDQRSAYETIKEMVRSNVFTEIENNGLNKGKLSVLAGLTKLRQLCNSCELVKDADLFTYDSVKTKVLINELKCIIPQHMALVFSQFTSMLDLLERDLNKAGFSTLRLDGKTNINQRQDLVTQFQSDENNAPVFLISLKAGNTGLNLTKADYVFLFDPWWNTAVESQAIDRTHRIGQTKQVFAYRMICRDSIEEKIIKMSGRKKKLADDLITTDESLVRGLTLEDIQYLLA